MTSSESRTVEIVFESGLSSQYGCIAATGTLVDADDKVVSDKEGFYGCG